MNSNKLKGLLKEKQKTYKECADALGISDTQFGKKVNGETEFWVSEAVNLAKFLGLSTYEFFAVFMPCMIEE